MKMNRARLIALAVVSFLSVAVCLYQWSVISANAKSAKIAIEAIGNEHLFSDPKKRESPILYRVSPSSVMSDEDYTKKIVGELSAIETSADLVSEVLFWCFIGIFLLVSFAFLSLIDAIVSGFRALRKERSRKYQEKFF